MDQAKYVAPIGVNILNPKLKGTSTCPCFGGTNLTTLPLGKTGAPGAFDLLNIDESHGGTGPSILADWILKGYDGYLSLGDYFSDAGAKWNSSEVQNALEARLNTELLFPVYDTISGTGANAKYHVIAWVGFHMTGSRRARQHRQHHRLVHGGRVDRYRLYLCDRAAEPRRPRRQPRRLTSKDKEQWHIELETS